MSARDTAITIYRGVPLDSTYSTVFNVSSESNFKSFLDSNFSYINYTDYSIIKNNKIRVFTNTSMYTTTADFLKSFNYLVFKNFSNYQNQNHYFFAFIDSVEYINDNTAEITYTIDLWHTWFSFATFNSAYIIRQHSTSDNVGENLQPESFPVSSDYVYDGYIKDQITNQTMFVLVTNEGGGSSNWQDGVYSPCKYYLFHTDSTGVQALTDFIQLYNITPSKIVNLYVAPSFLLGFEGTNPVMYSFSNGSEPSQAIGAFNESKTRTVAHATAQQVLSSLNLKNNKTFTAPYCYFNVNNAAGQVMDLRYELFDNGTPQLNISSTYVAPVRTVCKPYGYKKLSNLLTQGEAITLDNYPTCAFQNDAYMNWLINAGVPMVAEGLLNVAGGGGVGGAVSTATGFTSGAVKALTAAPIMQGNINSGNINVAHSNQTFFTACKHLPDHILKTIDAYFTRYGYAQYIIDTPNFNARQYYTYIQATDLNILGNIPQAAILNFKNVLNNGVTVWNTAQYSHFGDYSDNPI